MDSQSWLSSLTVRFLIVYQVTDVKSHLRLTGRYIENSIVKFLTYFKRLDRTLMIVSVILWLWIIFKSA